MIKEHGDIVFKEIELMESLGKLKHGFIISYVASMICEYTPKNEF